MKLEAPTHPAKTKSGKKKPIPPKNIEQHLERMEQIAEVTYNRKRTRELLDQKILKIIPKLFNAQASLAVGQSFLYKIEIDEKGRKGIPILISEQQEIENYLSGFYESDSSVYYYITTKEPSNIAIESLTNRVFGRPKESLELTGEVKLSLRELSLRALARRNEIVDTTATPVDDSQKVLTGVQNDLEKN